MSVGSQYRFGYSGTHKGMTYYQKTSLQNYLAVSFGGEFHHGDCVGADEQAHSIALACGYQPILHPPLDPRMRAFCKVPEHCIRPAKPYLVRNRDIVDETVALIATPFEEEE